MMMQRDAFEDLVIRKAAPEDARRILELWQGLGTWLQSEGIDQWRPDLFSLDEILGYLADGSELMLAVRHDDLAGTYLIMWSDPSVWGELDEADAGYIHRLAVSRTYRGLKLGRVLLQHAEARIKQNGKKTARLDCMADNERLNRYYRDCGYAFVKRREMGSWSANLYEKTLL